ncbi:hypothetical protein AN963_22880 [Brevibacillus choshinensis]|uniref:NodB homology domain-containing protein n=1 Tax=Brevibacillus choshinensis TaxID=54911 RepID=A0ABR5N191_BRECH|nr:polysaccharide deacetylase family protein [Brevibacillus choshinensis]KQL44265.1 hypothetical protein AN963_22880 [Brevibacillus choshinensis]
MKMKMIVISLCTAILVVGSVPVIAREERNRHYFEVRGEVVWEVPSKESVIALTFDDGPDPIYTPMIMDLLNQYNAKATFFAVGSRLAKHPGIGKTIVEHGHEIANHTFHHPNFKSISKEKIETEIRLTEETILKATGKHPTLFRSPAGIYNETIVNTVKKCGYLMIMWSWHQDTRDWSNPGVNKIVNKVLRNARKGDIVLFHDYRGNQTVKALQVILPELKKRGYRFVTVSELVQLQKINPVNKHPASLYFPFQCHL